MLNKDFCDKNEKDYTFTDTRHYLYALSTLDKGSREEAY